MKHLYHEPQMTLMIPMTEDILTDSPGQPGDVCADDIFGDQKF